MASENRVILELLQTHASLTSDNPTLVLGQKVYATGIGGLGYYPYKIGDGVTTYNSLPFVHLNRNDSAADFTSDDPVLLAGQHGYETDTGNIKIGDGSTAWNDLDYLTTPASVMGLAGRNLQTLWGLATPALAFAALRAIKLSGDFSGLRLGDYIDLPELVIPADSVKPLVYPARTLTWNASYENLRIEIQGFNDCLNVGNTAVPTANHCVMGFKNIPTTAPFNETDITTDAYPGSELYHWLHERVEQALIAAIDLDPYLIDRLVGTVAAWGWAGSEKIFLQTNVNVFGTTGFSHTDYGTGTQTQFPLFALNPSRKVKKYNGTRSTWWLAEPSAGSSTHFCRANDRGYASSNAASDVFGVVPAFLI